MAIAEFETVVRSQKRITIPVRVNVQEGQKILVKIYSVEEDSEIGAT